MIEQPDALAGLIAGFADAVPERPVPVLVAFAAGHPHQIRARGDALGDGPAAVVRIRRSAVPVDGWPNRWRKPSTRSRV